MVLLNKKGGTMKSFIAIFIMILFCAPTSWGQTREKHSDMFVFLEDGRKFTGILYETQDDAILLMPFKQLHKKKGRYYLTARSRPVNIPTDNIYKIVIKPNSYATGYFIGLLAGMTGTFAGMGVTQTGFFGDEELIGPPLLLVGTFATAPIIAGIYRNSNKINLLVMGSQDMYEKNREVLDSFIYFPNVNHELFKPQNQRVIEVVRNHK